MPMLFDLKFIRGLQILFAIIFIGCGGYLIFYILSFKMPTVDEAPEIAVSIDQDLIEQTSQMIDRDHKQKRDLFSPVSVVPSTDGSVPLVPSDQLPSNFKVVAIMVTKPATVVLEDMATNQTFFVQEGKPQAGFSIDHIEANQIFLNMQGHIIPIKRNETILSTTRP